MSVFGGRHHSTMPVGDRDAVEQSPAWGDGSPIALAAVRIGDVKSWDGETLGHNMTRDELMAAAFAALSPAPDAVDVDAVMRERDRLREALDWYGNPRNWRPSSLYMCGHHSPTNADRDAGAIARAALTPENPS